MNAYEMLIKDHQKVEDLFNEFEIADEDKKLKLAAKICEELTVHTMLEEKVFYPKARDVLDGSDEELIDHAEDEHADAKKLIEEIKQLSVGNQLDKKMLKLKHAITHHVVEEEETLFPELEKRNMEVVELAKEMKTKKKEIKSLIK